MANEKKTVKAKKVREGDYLPGLGNSYVFQDPERSEDNPGGRRLSGVHQSQTTGSRVQQPAAPPGEVQSVAISSIEFTRRFSLFAPSFTYVVRDQTSGSWIGEVARNEDNRRKWWASNKTWTDGGDLVQTFPTRYEAANALWHLAHGTATPETYGGYYQEEEEEEAT